MLVGVDGCRGAWLAVAREAAGGPVGACLQPTPAQLLQTFAAAEVIAVDVPIGLTDGGPRECDRLARLLLGRPRMASVFPAPIRPALAGATRAEADRLGRASDGRGVGPHAFRIYGHVAAWDEALRAHPRAQRRVYEAHPEVCFHAMNGHVPLGAGKKTAAGMAQRRRLVEDAFGKAALADALAQLAGTRFGMDDLLDAFATLWTARRIAAKLAVSLPAEPPRDCFGLPMAIWR